MTSPKFQHRHYAVIADAIAECSDVMPSWHLLTLVEALVQRFRRDNYAFNAERFRAACNGQPTPKDVRSGEALRGEPQRRYWIATSGRDGLNVSFFDNATAWVAACDAAEHSSIYDQIVSDEIVL